MEGKNANTNQVYKNGGRCKFGFFDEGKEKRERQAGAIMRIGDRAGQERKS